MREEIYENMKKLPVDDICWLIRNITYHLVSYYSEDNKGPIYDGSYDQLQIEQATRLQQNINGKVDILNQVFSHRNFENDYFEDLLTDNYYSKLKGYQEKSSEFERKAKLYDEMMDEVE